MGTYGEQVINLQTYSVVIYSGSTFITGMIYLAANKKAHIWFRDLQYKGHFTEKAIL